MDKHKKIQFRLSNGGQVHFCYVPEEVKDEFDSKIEGVPRSSNYWIIKWAAEDFGIVNISTYDDVEDLKNHIKLKYKELYPELYLESSTDQQGWTRVWFTQHIEKELEYF